LWRRPRFKLGCEARERRKREEEYGKRQHYIIKSIFRVTLFEDAPLLIFRDKQEAFM
jgi:hypothetical protein